MRSLIPALLLLVASVAAADVPPPDVCNQTGQACDRAQDPKTHEFNAKGTCKESTCTRYGLGPDGTRSASSYPCGQCVYTAEQPKPPTPPATTNPASPTEPRSHGRCSVATSGDLPSLGGLAFLAGGLLLQRRRRRGAVS